MDFLKLVDKKIVVFGLANRKSVACAIAKVLQEAGAEVIHVVRSEVRKETAEKLFPGARIFICDVENEKNIISKNPTRDTVSKKNPGGPGNRAHRLARRPG